VKTLDRLASALQSSFGPLAEQAAEESGVIKRRRKFDAVSLAKTFVLAVLSKPTASDEDIASMAASIGLQVSPQAISQRYSKELETFFRNLFTKMSRQVMHSDTALAPLLKRFTSVKLIDSSGIALPASMAQDFPGCGGNGESNSAALKLQTELDLATGELQCIQIESGRSPDQATDRQQVPLPKGTLRIADLGYFSAKVLASYSLWEAFFLTRLLPSVQIHLSGNCQSMTAWLASQNATVIDRDVVVGKAHPLACRLIAWRVPGTIAAARRREVRRRAAKKGHTPSAERLAACDWNILATNLTAAQLSVDEAIVLYRSRWQIELLFKRWKTYCRIDLMDGRTDEQSMTRLWIRLCGAILQQWIVVLAAWTESSTLSFAKVAKRLADWVDELATSLTSLATCRRYLKKLQMKVTATCKRTQRSGKPSTIQLLQDPNQLEYTLT